MIRNRDTRLTDNVARGNTRVDDGTVARSPFAFAASDPGALPDGDHGNHSEDDVSTTFFSLIGVLPPCPGPGAAFGGREPAAA